MFHSNSNLIYIIKLKTGLKQLRFFVAFQFVRDLYTCNVDKHLSQFLQQTDFSAASIQWFAADWSPRDYARLTKNDGTTAILLQSPPDNSPNAMVGHEIGKWSSMNKHFKSIGVNVPTILAEDLYNGYILMEDFRDDTIADKGIDAYLKATDILITMRDHPNALEADLIRYEDTHVYQALRFYPQYVLKDAKKTDDWFTAWKQVEDSLPPCPRALTHIDYAAMNLMWHDGDIGIIDFQAACNGPFVYDIVNLLEDIRRDIPDDIKRACKDHYCAQLSPDEKALFNQWYPVITAQFYARILGQIQFLTQEKGRDDLMQYNDPITKRFEKLLQLNELSPILRIIKG